MTDTKEPRTAEEWVDHEWIKGVGDRGKKQHELWCNPCKYCLSNCADLLKSISVIEGLRAKLKIAIEALEQIYEEPNQMGHDADRCIEDYDIKAWDIARTALAKINEGERE